VGAHLFVRDPQTMCEERSFLDDPQYPALRLTVRDMASPILHCHHPML
jgi:hypothetical protein